MERKLSHVGVRVLTSAFYKGTLGVGIEGWLLVVEKHQSGPIAILCIKSQWSAISSNST